MNNKDQNKIKQLKTIERCEMYSRQLCCKNNATELDGKHIQFV